MPPQDHKNRAVQLEPRRGATGTLRSGGRKNATEIFQERVDELKMKGLKADPIQILMEIACGMRLEDSGQLTEMKPAPEIKDRLKAVSELAAYMYPKRKAIEVTGSNGQPILFGVAPDLGPLPEAVDENVVTLEAKVVGELSEVISAEISADEPPALAPEKSADVDVDISPGRQGADVSADASPTIDGDAQAK